MDLTQVILKELIQSAAWLHSNLSMIWKFMQENTVPLTSSSYQGACMQSHILYPFVSTGHSLESGKLLVQKQQMTQDPAHPLRVNRSWLRAPRQSLAGGGGGGGGWWCPSRIEVGRLTQPLWTTSHSIAGGTRIVFTADIYTCNGFI